MNKAESWKQKPHSLKNGLNVKQLLCRCSITNAQFTVVQKLN